MTFAIAARFGPSACEHRTARNGGASRLEVNEMTFAGFSRPFKSSMENLSRGRSRRRAIRSRTDILAGAARFHLAAALDPGYSANRELEPARGARGSPSGPRQVSLCGSVIGLLKEVGGALIHVLTDCSLSSDQESVAIKCDIPAEGITRSAVARGQLAHLHR